MADFDDITGWQEELEKLRKSDVYTKVHGGSPTRVGPDPKIPLSALYDYAELLLKHDETRNAVIALKAWGDRQTEDFIDTDNDPTWPHEEDQLLADFASWFALKTGHGPNPEAYRRYGRYLAAHTAT